MVYSITGKDNKTLKLIRSLKRKNARQESRRFIAEGTRLVGEAFEYAATDVYCVVAEESFVEKNPEMMKTAERVCDKVYSVTKSVFDEISDTDTPQGIMAVMNMADKTTEPYNEISGDKCIAVLDGVSEPGNMGTIIRTAEALGFDGVYLMKGCTDIYGPKTVRATMGSVFRMSFKTDCTVEDIIKLRECGFRIISTTPSGDTEMESFLPTGNQAVVIGNEAHGISAELLEISDVKMKIRMDGMAESLNAAIAAGIVMHWLKNCR